MSESSPALPPWQRPWWYVDPAPGNRNIFGYLVAIHVVAIAGLVVCPPPTAKIAIAFVVAGLLGALGTSVGYHRGLAHRSVRLHPAVEQVLIFLALFNGSGPPRQWVANHRRHHATADTEDDVSSPGHGGFWWSHVRWLYQMPDSDPARWNPDMHRRRYDIWSTWHVVPFALSCFWGFVFGGAGFLWLGPLRLVYSTHAQCFVNSVAHMGAPGPKDRSANLWWLGLLQLHCGENWHHNHHDDPGSPRFGRAWWQLDLGWQVIRALQAVSLAEVSRPAPVR